ncbi:MAG: CHAP domain-containing protein, partial [Acidimicrobiales bacterium]
MPSYRDFAVRSTNRSIYLIAVLGISTISVLGVSSTSAQASVSGSQDRPPIYSNWPKNPTNWPCFATPSYACTGGNYNNTTMQKSGWPWTYYGGAEASTNSYGHHNCTLYAAFRLEENRVSNPGNLGNATDWATHAAAKGIVVNQTPSIGAIAQWNAGGGGDGHVAYVESVDPGGAGITITEDNYMPENASSFPGGYTAEVHITAGSAVWPANFIHFGGVGSGMNEEAFQANTGYLYTDSTSGPVNTHEGMMKGTSPSIVSLPNGTYEEAFQANTGYLYTDSTAGPVNTYQGMMAGTSPSIAASTNGSFEEAFQANTGYLYTFSSTSGPVNTHEG